ncbi:MAG: hypothetical protein GWO41_03210, partial [candidate division Zixibacteria bacterium]|nr:hypothetical protein [candidate division Zixibacteria bacterium]NIW39272.1 hypothetical protein [candidate division Zixibacteria bacterium]
MISSTITIDYHSEAILDTDEVFQEWVNEPLSESTIFSDLFKLSTGIPVAESIHQAISSGSTQHLDLIPLFDSDELTSFVGYL